MGWLSNLFSSGGNNNSPTEGSSEEHKGYTVTAMPESRGGQYQTVGEIRSTNPEDERVHRFIRADAHPSFEQACQHTLLKGKQIINERGDEVLD